MKIVFWITGGETNPGVRLGTPPVDVKNPMQVVLDPAIFTREALAYDEQEELRALIAEGGDVLAHEAKHAPVEETLEAQFEIIRRYVRIELRKWARGD